MLYLNYHYTNQLYNNYMYHPSIFFNSYRFSFPEVREFGSADPHIFLSVEKKCTFDFLFHILCQFQIILFAEMQLQFLGFPVKNIKVHLPPLPNLLNLNAGRLLYKTCILC